METLTDSSQQSIPVNETEIQVLTEVYNHESIRQRDLAEVVGVSLGMTNSILKRLAKKGLLTIKKVNSRNIQYAVTAEGFDEISRRSANYLKRTIKNVVFFKDIIEKLVVDAKADGYEGIQLVGESDLGFMIEHFCRKLGLGFSSESLQVSNVLHIISEEQVEQIFAQRFSNQISLAAVLEREKNKE